MAYVVRRPGDRFEIRESRATPRGPRSRQLARFQGALTPEVIDRALRSASRPIDVDALIARARAAGIPVEHRRPEREARALLARLRRPDPIDPVVAGLLQRALAEQPVAALPDRLAEVADWVGASPAERGAALRDLLDAYGRIAAARPRRRTRPRRPFPHFSSVESAAAS